MSNILHIETDIPIYSNPPRRSYKVCNQSYPWRGMRIGYSFAISCLNEPDAKRILQSMYAALRHQTRTTSRKYVVRYNENEVRVWRTE